jgi:MFS family permease
MSRTALLSVQLGAILFMAGGIVGPATGRTPRQPRRVLMAGCALTILVGALLAPMLGSGSLLPIGAFLSLALLVMGFVYGPLGAFLPSLFPARVRYTGASIAFNVGGILGGGLAPDDRPGPGQSRRAETGRPLSGRRRTGQPAGLAAAEEDDGRALRSK